MKTKNSQKSLTNIIIAVVILAVVALGAWAVTQKVQENILEQQELAKPKTIADLAGERALTAQEYIEGYGLSEYGFTGETTTEEMYEKLTIRDMASLEGVTTEDFKALYGVEDLPDDTRWMEAMYYVKMGTVALTSGYTFEQYKQMMQLPDGVTEDTTYGELLEMTDGE